MWLLTTVLTENWDLWEVQRSMKAGLKYASRGCGERSAGTSGTLQMPPWPANNLDMLSQAVRKHLILALFIHLLLHTRFTISVGFKSHTFPPTFCRGLCFRCLAAQAFSSAYFGQGGGPILLDDVACTASDTSLVTCSSSGIGTHNCNHTKDAGVRCERMYKWNTATDDYHLTSMHVSTFPCK